MSHDHDDEINNKSNSRSFDHALQAHVSRRKVLAGGLTAAAH